jgi:hypothetical protein
MWHIASFQTCIEGTILGWHPFFRTKARKFHARGEPARSRQRLHIPDPALVHIDPCSAQTVAYCCPCSSGTSIMACRSCFRDALARQRRKKCARAAADNTKPASPMVAGSGVGVKIAAYGWLSVGASGYQTTAIQRITVPPLSLRLNVPEFTNPGGALVPQTIWNNPAGVTGNKQAWRSRRVRGRENRKLDRAWRAGTYQG